LDQTKFFVGQLVHHQLFDYRGVIIDVDGHFMGSDEWYERVARSCPPKDAPWYHVLVHDSANQTYVAERNLEPDVSGQPINHPLVSRVLGSFEQGVYRLVSQTN